jgi:hypothetical protein
MSFAFEVIFVKMYSLAVLLFEREKKLVVKQEQDGRFFLMKGQKDLIRRRITQLSSFVIPFRLPNSSLLLY